MTVKAENEKKRLLFKRTLIFFDLSLILLFISIGLVIKPDYAMIVAYSAILPILMITGRKNMIKEFLLASLFALVWILISHQQYGYNKAVLMIDGVNLFPLFAWACGLMASYVILSHITKIIHRNNKFFKFFVYLAIYWPSLIGLEYLAYHVLEFRNSTTGHYPGLPIIDAMHAPVWMQISYLIMGPLFFIIALFMDGVDNKKKIDNQE